MTEQVQTITVAAHESECARLHKIVKWLIIGWAVTAVFLGSIVYSFVFGEYEVTTETTTTTEETWTSENSADSGDGGVAYAGDGDLSVGYGEQ